MLLSIPSPALESKFVKLLFSSRKWIKSSEKTCTVNPRRHRGVNATPSGFSEIYFLFTGRMSSIFIQLTDHPFYVPLKISRPWPLTFDLWRHNWGHVRRKMRSVAHNLQASVLRHLSEWHLSERHLSEPFSATAHLSDWLLERLTIWTNVILAIIKYSEYQFQRSQFERVFRGYHGDHLGECNYGEIRASFS